MHNLLFEQFYKNFILGKHAFVRSTSVYKRAILTGLLSLLVVVICIVYLFFDLSISVFESAPFYFIMIGFAVLSFVLNRLSHYGLAKIILLYSVIAMIYVFGTSEPIESGNYLSIFPLVLAAFALYGYKHKQYAIVFTFIALGVFLFMFYGNVSIITYKHMTPAEVRENFLIHFIVSLVASLLIILFFTRLNFTIENYLKSNEHYLNKILEELEASKQRFELAFKGSKAGLYDWDIKHNNIYHSPMWKNMLGYDEDELEDFKIEKFFELTHPNDVDRVKKKLNDLLQRKSKYVEEVRLRTKSGKYRWFMDSGMALWDEDGQPVRMVGSIIDITEMKEAEERIAQQNKILEKTNAELDQFVYSTSHDLRAPLMSILGLIDLAKGATKKNEINNFLDLMANRVNRLDEFIGEIIDFSRNSRLEINMEEILLHDLVNEIVNDLQFIENSNKIEVYNQIGKDFVIISDKKRIQTILRNLISNSFKYHNLLQKEPFIKVDARNGYDAIAISVIDNGDGIKDDKKEHIFEMFYRGSDKSKGSGLGLYIAKEMTEKIKGTIKLKTEYGSGSEFSVELPQNISVHKLSSEVHL